MKVLLKYGLILSIIILITVFSYQYLNSLNKEDSIIKYYSDITSGFNTPPQEVQKAAEAGLKEFFHQEKNFDIMYKNYGFKSLEEVNSATLGKAYHIYIIDNLNKLVDYSSQDRISMIITPTNTWHFSVLTNNQPLIDLSVQLFEDEWQAVGIGGSFTKEMYQISTMLPDLLKAELITTECPFKLVRILPLNAVFVFVECQDQDFIIPLTKTGWFDLEEKKLYKAEKAMVNYAEAAKQRLNNQLK